MLHKFSEGKPYNVIALCMTRFKSYDQVRLINELCKDCGQTGIKVIIFSSVTDLYNGGVNDIGEAQIFHRLNQKDLMQLLYYPRHSRIRKCLVH